MSLTLTTIGRQSDEPSWTPWSKLQPERSRVIPSATTELRIYGGEEATRTGGGYVREKIEQ